MDSLGAGDCSPHPESGSREDTNRAAQRADFLDIGERNMGISLLNGGARTEPEPW